MSKFIISNKIEKLADYKFLKKKFDTGYLRQIDKFIPIRHRKRWLFANSFFNKNVLETYDSRVLALLELFSEPMPFLVFLKRLSDKFHFNFVKPDKTDLKKIGLFLSTTRELIKHNFVVTEDFNEYTQLEKMRRYLVSKPRFAGCAYIMTSLDCNFRCPNCFIYRGDWNKKPASTMTPKTFDHLHGFVMKMIPKGIKMEFNYTFYGGEPLLNKPMIEYAGRRIRELEKKGDYGKIKPKMLIVSNGSLIDDEIIRIIKKYDIGIGVSLDGVGASHNANRIFPGGLGTFKTVLEGIRRLEKAGIKYGISWTVGPKNIGSVARDIKWVVKHLKTKGIFFNIMQDISGKTFKQAEEDKFFRKMHHIYDVLRKHGISEGRLQRYRFAGKKRWQLMPYPFYCAAVGGGQFVMRPDGKIGICHAGLMQKEAQWQTPEEISDFLQDPIYLQWLARTPAFIKKCYQDCNYFAFCAGGCAYRVEKIKGSIYDISEDVCMVERFLMERAIIEDHW